MSRCGNAENRLLLFLGFEDELGESWQASEKEVLDFYFLHLDVTQCSEDTEQIHGLGRLASSKSWLVIVGLLL